MVAGVSSTSTRTTIGFVTRDPIGYWDSFSQYQLFISNSVLFLDPSGLYTSEASCTLATSIVRTITETKNNKRITVKRLFCEFNCYCPNKPTPCILPRHSGVLCTRTRQLVLLMHDWVWESCDWQLVCSNWGSPRLELHPKGDCELRFVCRCGCLDSWFFAIVVFCCRSFR